MILSIKKHISFLITVLFVCICLCIFISCDNGNHLGNISGDTTQNTDKVLLETVDWNCSTTPIDSIEYIRPDFDAFLAKINELDSLINSGAEYSEIENKYDILDKAYSEIYGSYGILSIRQYQNVNDEDIVKETEFFSEKMTEIEDKLYSLLLKMYDSKYREIADISDEFAEYLRMKNQMIDDEYKELSKKETELINEYKKKSTNVKIKVNGKEYSESDIYDLYANGKISYETYIEYYNQYLKNVNESVAQIYIDLVKVYKRYAEKAGCESYAEYCYQYVYDRDFTLEDAETLSKYVKEYLVPLYNELLDSFTDYERTAVSYILYNINASIEGYDDEFKDYFSEVSDEMLEAYVYLFEFEQYDFSISDNKQQGAFTTYVDYFDIPFMFLTPSGDVGSVMTFVHEFGHFYSFYAGGEDSTSNIDICEIHSQANEWLFLEKLGFSDAVTKAYAKYLTIEMLDSIINGCLFDEFQRLIYTGNYDTAKEINDLFESLCIQYEILDSSSVDMTYFWSLVNHNFESPMYYISYAVSLFPSYDIYYESLNNRDSAVEIYREIIGISDEYGILDIIEKYEFTNIFTEEGIKSFAQKIKTANGIK